MSESTVPVPLPDLDTLRKRIGWDKITEAAYSDGSRNWPVFILHPDNPAWPAIFLYAGPDGFHELCVGEGGAHFHLGRDPDQGIELARSLAAGEQAVVVTRFDNGVLDTWKLVPADGWPDTFLKFDLALDESGQSPLVDADGVHYLPPQYTRILFNREPFPDSPDFSQYAQVKCGWMTPERRDSVFSALAESGRMDENLLI